MNSCPANFLLNYLDGAARLAEVSCRPSVVKRDADSIYSCSIRGCVLAIRKPPTSCSVASSTAAAGFLALRKVALRWFDEVEGTTTSRVKAQVSEARAEPTDTQREFTKLWGEVAENKKLLTQVLAQQKELLTLCAGAPSNVSATPQRPSAPPPRRRYGDLECYQCH